MRDPSETLAAPGTTSTAAERQADRLGEGASLLVPFPVDDVRIGRNREGDAPAEPFTDLPEVTPLERLRRSLALPAGPTNLSQETGNL